MTIRRTDRATQISYNTGSIILRQMELSGKRLTEKLTPKESREFARISEMVYVNIRVLIHMHKIELRMLNESLRRIRKDAPKSPYFKEKRWERSLL